MPLLSWRPVRGSGGELLPSLLLLLLCRITCVAVLACVVLGDSSYHSHQRRRERFFGTPHDVPPPPLLRNHMEGWSNASLFMSQHGVEVHFNNSIKASIVELLDSNYALSVLEWIANDTVVVHEPCARVGESFHTREAFLILKALRGAFHVLPDSIGVRILQNGTVAVSGVSSGEAAAFFDVQVYPGNA